MGGGDDDGDTRPDDSAGEPLPLPASGPYDGASPADPGDVPQDAPADGTSPEPGSSPPGSPDDGRVPLHLPAPRSAAGDGTPLLAPAPPMLHRPLALQRALRPLKRKVPSPHARVLDEYATADRIARLGAHPDVWLPVLRPAPDRWLRLNLVHDTGPTMPVWRPLVRELHTVLAQSGIFRTITLHRAGPDGRAHQVPDLADGRTATLVVSDCMGPQWRPGPAGDLWYRTLRRWSARMPLAVVQPLPEHLWHTTALPAEPGLLTPRTAAAPSAALAFTPYDPDAAPRHPSAVPLPVLEPAPSWLSHWAALLSDHGGGSAPGSVTWLPPAPVPLAEAARDIASLDPEELVLRFRGTASPEAFRLAGHLSLAVPALPVMRLVQHALLRDPRPQHLAEIILSGMLTAAPGPPGSYAFRPGVRDLLRRSLPRTARGRTREFLARVGGLIDERAGLAAGEFRAEARLGPEPPDTTTDATPDDTTDSGPDTTTGGDDPTTGDSAPTTDTATDPDDAAFATVSEDTVRRLGADEPGRLVGGRYRLVGQRGQGRRVWEAVDTRTGRTVVVHRYPEQPAPPERFLSEAQVLAGISDPRLVPVLDFGVDGETPYLVTAFVDGVTLTELERGNGPLPFPVFARIASHVAGGLKTLHRHGLRRGQHGRDGLLLCPDGTVVISRFAPGEQPGTTDFEELDALLRELAPHVDAPAPYDRLLTQIAEGRLREPAQEAAAQLSTSHDEPPPTARNRDRLRFALLGPVRVSLHWTPLKIPSPDALALLCMLLLRHGRPVRHRELAQGLWQEPIPDREAAGRIAGLAAQLRRMLGPGVVATPTDGLALHVPDAFIDVADCEELLGRRRESQDRGSQRALVQQALDLFHGDPLDGVPGPAAGTARARLRDLRLTLYADRAELDIALGDFQRATEDLTALLREYPGHEEFGRVRALALELRDRIAEPPRDLDLVRGPLPFRLTTALPGPVPGRTAIVLATSDGRLFALEGDGRREFPGRPTRYYEVDLTTQRSAHTVSLASSRGGVFAASVELSWHVDDPVAFVRGETGRILDVLLTHVVREASRLTRRHPVRRAGAAQQAVRDGLPGDWPVPGLKVECFVRLTPQAGPQGSSRPTLRAVGTPAEVLNGADAVLLGFEGPLTRLFSQYAARNAAAELMSLVEDRAPRVAAESAVHPMEVLRAYADDPRLGPLLRDRLDVLELQAASRALQTPYATSLVVALASSRFAYAFTVVTDVSQEAVRRHLGVHSLSGSVQSVHGRSPDPGLLMPDPDCLRRALGSFHRQPGNPVMIGSSLAELGAAQRLGLPFIGYAHSVPEEDELRAEGCDVVVRSLMPLVNTVSSYSR